MTNKRPLQHVAGSEYHELSTGEVYRRCLKLIFKRKKECSQTIFFGLLSAAGNAAILYAIYFMTNLVNQKVGTGMNILYIGMVIVLSLLAHGCTYLANIIGYDIVRHIQTDLVREASNALCSTGLIASNRNEKINLMLLLRQDVRAVRGICLNLIQMAIRSAQAIILLGSLAFINWTLVLAIGGICLGLAGIIRGVNRKIVHESLSLRDHVIQNAGTTSQFIKALPLLKIFGRNESGPSIVSNLIHDRFLIRRNIAKLRFLLLFIWGIMGNTGMVLIIGLVLFGSLGASIEEMIPALVGFVMTQQALSAILQILPKNHEFAPIARHYFNKADQWKKEVLDQPDKTRISRIDDITFKNLHFNDPAQQLDPWDTHWEKGERYLFYSIKAPLFKTFVDLFSLASDDVQGQVLINGIDLNHIHPESLYANLSFFTHDTPVFPLSVTHNITIACKDPNQTQLHSRLSILEIDRVFANLPEKLDTVLLKHNVQLSDEQRATIAAARMMLSEASLFMIDMIECHHLNEQVRMKFIQTLFEAQKDAILIIKPASLDDLEFCSQFIYVKRKDLIMQAHMDDLKTNRQSHDFYLTDNPAHRVGITMPGFETASSFEKAVWLYNWTRDKIDESYDGHFPNGDASKKGVSQTAAAIDTLEEDDDEENEDEFL